MATLEEKTKQLAEEYVRKAPATTLTEEEVQEILTDYFGMQERGTYADTLLAMKTGKTTSQITRILNKLGLPLKQQQYDTKDPIAQQAHKYINQTPNTQLTIDDVAEILRTYNTLAQQEQPKATEIAEKTGLTRRQIGLVLKALELPYLFGTNNPKIAEYVQQGLTTQEIADKEGITRQRAQQLIQETGLSQEWKQKRQELKEEPQLYQRIADALYFHLLQRAQTENPAMYYATICSRRPRAHPYEKLEQLFTTYFEGKKQGKTPSTYELQEKTGIFFTTIAKILRKNGLERSRKSKTRELVPPHKKQAIAKLHDAGLSLRDISHYLKIRYLVVRDEVRMGGRPNPPHIGKECLVLHNYEEIYEAQQLGYTPEETAELLDLSEKTIKYALDNKNTIEQKIQQTHEILEAMKC